MNFSQALELLKGGGKVRRKVYAPNVFYFIDCEFSRIAVSGCGDSDDNILSPLCHECEGIFDSDDVLADDWEEVKDES